MFLVERAVTTTTGTPVSNVAILGVTSMSPDRGTPETIARAVRGQWKIEVLHWLRDTVYREDDSTVHTRSGPRVMAALRNLAIGALRLHGRTDITEATRWDQPKHGQTVHPPRTHTMIHDLKTAAPGTPP